MEVILLERVEKLGLMGEVVNVKPGFARNYLLPRKKALRATKANIAQFDTQRSQFEAANIQKRDEAEKIGNKLEGLTVVLVRQASDSDQLFGSVTTRDMAVEIAEAGFIIDKNQVQLDQPIKTVGMHNVTVRLHPEVSVTVTANVARTEDEADAQARGERPGRVDDDDEVVAETFVAAETVDFSETAQDTLEQPAETDDADGADDAKAGSDEERPEA